MNSTAASVPVLQRGRVLIAALVAFVLIVSGALVASPALADDAETPVTTAEAASPTEPAEVSSAPDAGAPETDESGSGDVEGTDTAEGSDGAAGEGSETGEEGTAGEGADESLSTLGGSSALDGDGPTAPSIVVSKVRGLNGEGETITVTGTGFVANPPATDATRPPVGTGNFGGVYVVFAKWPTLWAPSEGGTRPTAGNLAQRWGVHAAQFGGSINAGNGGFVLPEDGSFELTFEVADVSELDGNYGIYTYAGGGATYAPFETFTPLTFAGPPSVGVSKTIGLNPEGDTITVTLTDFLPNPPATDATRPPVGTGNFGGVYVVFAKWPTLWAPSEGGTRPTAGNLAQRWGVHAAQFGGSINAGNGGFVLPEDGSFELTFEVADVSELDGNYGIYTYAGGGATYAPFETFTPLTFAEEPTVPEEPEEPTVPTTPTNPAGGSLRWAISSDFTAYITSIAHGEIIVSGGATRSGGQFQWGQGSGSTYNFDTGRGMVPYTGSVRFTGHGGVLDVTMSNPRITITSASAATLSFASGGSRVTFATLNLAGGVKATASNGAVTYTAVPASLTAAGRDQILEGFPTALNPVTFTIGSPASAPAGSTGTVAKADSTDADELPATPPASSGLEITEADLAALQAGKQFTISGSGFEANEEGIKVVVYSDPVLLDLVQADAEGVATWTGTLPATLADGAHTLTLQGSVNHGLTFDLKRPVTTVPAGECAISVASLKWGFKENFRVYLEGIAKGGWELDGVEYIFPDFVWAAGTGSYSASTRAGLVDFGGTVRFHGHEGALDTTIRNARLEFAGDIGYLVFDVAGETQGGQAVDVTAVRFAEFSLAGVNPEDGVLTLDSLPVTLTAAGADAFGTYPVGEQLDPVSALVEVGADCGQAAPVEPPATTPSEEPAPGADGGIAPVVWILGGIALLALLALIIWLIARRRRAAEQSA